MLGANTLSSCAIQGCPKGSVKSCSLAPSQVWVEHVFLHSKQIKQYRKLNRTFYQMAVLDQVSHCHVCVFPLLVVWYFKEPWVTFRCLQRGRRQRSWLGSFEEPSGDPATFGIYFLLEDLTAYHEYLKQWRYRHYYRKYEDTHTHTYVYMYVCIIISIYQSTICVHICMHIYMYIYIYHMHICVYA